jgi:hypothetical protein
MSISSKDAILPNTLISQKIYFIREARIMLDVDLAQLYGVAIRQMLATPVPDKKAIGFHAGLEGRTRHTKPNNPKRK